MLHAKSLLHWSVKHYQITYEWPSGCGLEMSVWKPVKVTCIHLLKKPVSVISTWFLVKLLVFSKLASSIFDPFSFAQ